MNEETQVELLAQASDAAGQSTKPISIVVRGGSAHIGASLLRAIRESNLGGQVVVLDEASSAQTLEARELLQRVQDDAMTRARDAVLVDAALGVLTDRRPAPFKPAAPRELTPSDHASLEAAQQKRERKAARLRRSAPLP